MLQVSSKPKSAVYSRRPLRPSFTGIRRYLVSDFRTAVEEEVERTGREYTRTELAALLIQLNRALIGNGERPLSNEERNLMMPKPQQDEPDTLDEI